MIAAAGSVFLLFSKRLGIEVDPTALTGFGAILTYVLTQRGQWTKENGHHDGGVPQRRYTIWERLGRIWQDPQDDRRDSDSDKTGPGGDPT